MARRDVFSELLRDRILLATLGALPAMGCNDNKAASVPTNPVETSPLVVEPPRPVSAEPAAPITTETAPSAVIPQPSVPSVARELPPGCYAPFSTMRSVGTGEPASAPPPSAFDKNGCLPTNLVTNGCCNGASSGPRFEKGGCCYTFPNGPCCGRPFLVDGRVALPEIVASSGWSGAFREGPSPTERAVRAGASQGFARDARMEHASIASFARFTMDLLAIGAPADLVRDAGRAMLDEIDHAETCFGLASRFAGAPLGPAPFPAAAAPSTRSFDEIIDAVVVEGCVGETLAAYVASCRHARAEDPEVRAALARICEDEARHAELAWRFIRWILRERGITMDRIATTLERAIDAAARDGVAGAPECSTRDDEALARLGVFSARDEAVAIARGVEGILRPAMQTLRAAAQPAHAARVTGAQATSA